VTFAIACRPDPTHQRDTLVALPMASSAKVAEGIKSNDLRMFFGPGGSQPKPVQRPARTFAPNSQGLRQLRWTPAMPEVRS
jgi:hypothetical protein